MSESHGHTVLEARGLGIGYRSSKRTTVVTEKLNFKFGTGQLVGLEGANGIGKSTLLRTLSAMQPALSGEVLINSEEINRLNPLTLATRLSVVLTEVPASRNLTVTELVSLGRQPYTNLFGRLRASDKEAITRALDLTETNVLADKKCYELSDGQLQRVVIARALAQDTGLIILDEPTTHLDLYHRAYIVKLLKRLSSEENKTVLFSTHEIDLAIQIADMIIVMDTDGTYVDEPCSLISDGRFKNLFPSDSIEFDAVSGRFTIRN